MSLYLGENKIADNTCSRNIGEIVASTIPLSDAGLHLLDGSLISSAGSYAKFVNYIAGLYNQTVPTSVTYYAWTDSYNGTIYTTSSTPSVGDATYYYSGGVMSDQDQPITNIDSGWIAIMNEYSPSNRYNRNSSSDVTLTVQTPPPYFCSESDWQSSVSTYGVCGKFVYDSVNNTVRLPKITGFTEGTIDPTVLGDLTQAGLPNITGTHCGGFGADRARSGAFSGTWRTAQAATGGKDYNNSGGDSGWEIKFDASRSSSIYGNSNTVQPQSIKVLYYIVIANSVKTNIEVDIDEIATDLNGKADVDFTNVNSSGTSLASGWAMPSSRYIDLNWNTQTSYTLPANGMVIAHGRSSGTDCWMSSGIYDNNDTWMFAVEVRGASGTLLTWATPMLKAGWKINIDVHNLSTKEAFRFIYAEGEQ